MGGRWFEEHCGKHANNSDALARIAVAHLAQICRISIVPQRIKVSVQKNCIAQYTVGHLSRVENARKAIADEGLPISLVGSSFDGVGINDVIMSAKRQVESVAAHR